MNRRLIVFACAVGGITFALAVVFLPQIQQGNPIAFQDGAIEPIAAKYVCMVNDQHYEGIQIEVPVEDKTYYGCCQGCVAKLKNSPDVRTATDPVTGNTVDKSTAVIGALLDGSVRYFESETTLARYDPASEAN